MPQLTGIAGRRASSGHTGKNLPASHGEGRKDRLNPERDPQGGNGNPPIHLKSMDRAELEANSPWGCKEVVTIE